MTMKNREPSHPRRRSVAIVAAVLSLTALALAPALSAETWRGLTVVPEDRCSLYDRKREYPCPQSVEQDIVRQLGAVYEPYSGTCFGNTRQTDIELCAAIMEPPP